MCAEGFEAKPPPEEKRTGCERQEAEGRLRTELEDLSTEVAESLYPDIL